MRMPGLHLDALRIVLLSVIGNQLLELVLALMLLHGLPMSAQLGELDVLKLLSAVLGRLATSPHLLPANRWIGISCSTEVVVGLLVVLGWRTVNGSSLLKVHGSLIAN